MEKSALFFLYFSMARFLWVLAWENLRVKRLFESKTSEVTTVSSLQEVVLELGAIKLIFYISLSSLASLFHSPNRSI